MANQPSGNQPIKPESLESHPLGEYSGFRSKQEFEWWEFAFTNRAVVMERPVLIGTLDDFPQRNSFKLRQGWVDYLRRQGNSCNFSICREFIASLLPIPNEELSYVAKVRGVDLPFNFEVVSAVIAIPALLTL